MSCCGEEDDEILEQLIPSEIPNKLIENLGTCDDCDIISPMNSNFSALFSVDIVRSIFEQLSSSDLARAACVCRLWNLIASSREMHVAVFKAPWKLKHVIGNPTSNNFWRDNGIGRFAISHRIVRGDTVASLAVKYAVQVMDIKRLNNMLSDHGIHSRERLLIPVTSPSLLINATCYIELDTYAKREVAVIYLDGGNSTGKITISNTGIISQRNRRRILESVKRGMQVDECTAEYYLSISNGDPRAAFSEYSDDLRWDQQESSP